MFSSWKQGENDNKIIAVCADDPEYRHYNDISELPPHRLAEIKSFFEDCILNGFSFGVHLDFIWYFAGSHVIYKVAFKISELQDSFSYIPFSSLVLK